MNLSRTLCDRVNRGESDRDGSCWLEYPERIEGDFINRAGFLEFPLSD